MKNLFFRLIMISSQDLKNSTKFKKRKVEGEMDNITDDELKNGKNIFSLI